MSSAPWENRMSLVAAEFDPGSSLARPVLKPVLEVSELPNTLAGFPAVRWGHQSGFYRVEGISFMSRLPTAYINVLSSIFAHGTGC